MAENLREFLVTLGFSVDESSFKKFITNVGAATTPILKLGAAAATTAAAVEVMVERVATQMTALFYSAQRANSTAASLMEVGFAARQIGLTAEQGRSALENFAAAMRMNPGTEGLLSALGVQTRDANGALLDTRKTFDNFMDAMERSPLPLYVKTQYAGMLGQDPTTFYQMLVNNPAREAQERRQAEIMRQMGFNADEAAPKFAQFSRDVGDLETHISTAADLIALKFLPASDNLVRWATTAADRLAPLADDLQHILDVVTRLWNLFEKFNDKLGGAPAKAAPAALGPAGIAAMVATQQDVVTDPSKLPIHAEKAWLWNHLPLGIRNNNPGNLMPGGVEATYDSAEAGLAAMAATLRHYAARGYDTVKSIVSRWAPAAGGNDVASYIGDVTRRTGFGAGQHLDLSNPSTLANLMNAMTFHEQGRNPYAPELFARAASARYMGAGATLNQSTNITVNGATDPAGTAKKIGDVQGRVNGDLARNLSSVVQ